MERIRLLFLTLLPWLAVVLCAGLSCLLWQSQLLHKWDYKLLRYYQQLDPAVPELPIELVTIKKIDGQAWPWSSLDYAILLNTLSPFSPSVMALDLPIEEGDPLYPIYDIQLANQMARFPSVIISQTSPRSVPAPFVSAANTAPSRWLQSPNQPLEKVALALWTNNTWQASFALQVVASHLGADWSASKILPNEHITLRNKENKLLLTIPVDAECRTLIHYNIFSKKADATEFYSAIISAEDLRNGGSGLEGFHEIRRRIILVGTEAPGTYSPVTSPAGALPSVYLQDQTLRQLLSQRFTSELNSFFYLLIIVSACSAAGAFALIPSRPVSLSLLLVYLTLCLLGSYFSYELGKIWWHLFPLLFGVALSWFTARCLSLLSRLDQEKQRELFEDF
ncbi:MAG: CHASE2 domain-containing protein [Blastochloris sp.]|nr:CHASE2 domain-containing protein [Blastochloris sp.]